MKAPITDLRFRQQFVVTSDGWRPSPDWILQDLACGLKLARHPDLICASDGQCVLLGTCIDSLRPLDSSQEIVSRIQRIQVPEHLEASLDGLVGRWVLITAERVYHDACGLKPVYFQAKAGEGLCLASQPSLLAESGRTQRCQQTVRQFESYANSGAWPVNLVPYTGVSQLSPNHFLCLKSGRAHRFWPRHWPGRLELEEGAAIIGQLLRASLVGLTHRGKAYLGLSGGYDSRTILSVVHDLNPLVLYNIVTPSTAEFDRTVPVALASLVQKSLLVRHSTPGPSDQLADLLNNVGGMFYDEVLQSLQTCHTVVGDGPAVEGLGAEVLRAQFHRQAPDGLPSDPEGLARIAGFGGNPLAERALKGWLDGLPQESWVDPRDLLYWESRLGTWAATGWTLKEALYESFSPYNNRMLLETGLRVDLQHRRRPHQLFRKIIELHSPELLKWTFNDEQPPQRGFRNLIKRKLGLIGV